MKRPITAAAAGALLLALTLLRLPAVSAQEDQEGLSPVSIYALDDGTVDDSVGDPALTTPAGTVEGDATPTEDRFGNPTGALACGPDGYVQTEEESNVNPLTFSVWFRADDVSDEHSIVDSDESGQYGHSLIIGYDDPADDTDTPRDGSLSIQYHDGVWDTDVVIQQGEWTHVFVTYSGDKIRVYVGTDTRPTELVAEREYDTSAGFDGSAFRFCRHNPDDPQPFVGAIDDVRFYDAALTPEEVEEVHETPVDPDLTTTVPDEEPTEPETRDAPLCPEDPVSNLYGDVHVRTPDSLVYDFQFMGDFLMAESDDGDAVVQTRMEPWSVNPKVSVNTRAAFDVAGDVLQFSVEPDLGFTVNGEPTDLPTEPLTLTNGGTISIGEPARGFRNDLTIDWPDGDTRAVLRMSSRPFIDVGICRLDQETTYEGLVGDLDGDPNDDMTVRDGDPIEQPASVEDLAEFGDSWRVDPDESLFDDELPAEEQITPDELVTIDDLDDGEREAAEQLCIDQGITDPLALHQCTYDVAATGEDGFADSAGAQQEAVEELPAAVPDPVVAVEGAAPEEIPLAGTPIGSESDGDDGGASPVLFVVLGGLVLALGGAVAALVLKNKDDGSGRGAGPGPSGGPGGPSLSNGPSGPGHGPSPAPGGPSLTNRPRGG